MNKFNNLKTVNDHSSQETAIKKSWKDQNNIPRTLNAVKIVIYYVQKFLDNFKQ